MSLLMEALRKAEEAKRKSQEQEAAAPAAAPDPASGLAAAADAGPGNEAETRTDSSAPLFSLEPREPSPPPPPPLRDPEPDTPDTAGTLAALPEPAAASGEKVVIIEAVEAPAAEEAEATVSGPIDLAARRRGSTRRKGSADLAAAPADRDRSASANSGESGTDSSKAASSEADSAGTSNGQSGKTARAARERDRLAAASVFAAKQTPGAQTPRSRTGLLLGLALVAVCGGGGTLWYLLQPSSSGVLLNPALSNQNLAQRSFLDELPNPEQAGQAVGDIGTVDTVGTDSATNTDPATTATDGSELALADSVTDSASDSASQTGSADQALTDATSAATPAAELAAADSPAAPAPTVATAQAQEGSAPAPLSAPSPAAQPAAADAAPAGPARTLQISRSTGRSETDTRLQVAWNALQGGELQRATLLYQEVLAEQPGNRDALIGLAAIQLRNGDLAAATQLYTRVLTLNPQDPYAQAGLLQATRGGSDPAYEAELRSLLQRHPGMAPLHFALGNHYAGQQRWSEAQSAYFEALLQARRDSSLPVSPDYAFNLAVSLERLQQPDAALEYYRQAEALARTTQSGFDAALLQRRIAALQERNAP